jgi:hypothetical protein
MLTKFSPLVQVGQVENDNVNSPRNTVNLWLIVWFPVTRRTERYEPCLHV